MKKHIVTINFQVTAEYRDVQLLYDKIQQPTKVFAIAGATERSFNICNSIVLLFQRDEQSQAKVLNFGNRK